MAVYRFYDPGMKDGMDSVAKVMDSIGQFERQRQDAQLSSNLMRIASEPAGSPEERMQKVYSAVADFQPQYSGGLGGVMQKAGNFFAPQSQMPQRMGGMAVEDLLQQINRERDTADYGTRLKQQGTQTVATAKEMNPVRQEALEGELGARNNATVALRNMTDPMDNARYKAQQEVATSQVGPRAMAAVPAKEAVIKANEKSELRMLEPKTQSAMKIAKARGSVPSRSEVKKEQANKLFQNIRKSAHNAIKNGVQIEKLIPTAQEYFIKNNLDDSWLSQIFSPFFKGDVAKLDEIREMDFSDEAEEEGMSEEEYRKRRMNDAVMRIRKKWPIFIDDFSKYGIKPEEKKKTEGAMDAG